MRPMQVLTHGVEVSKRYSQRTPCTTSSIRLRIVHDQANYPEEDTCPPTLRHKFACMPRDPTDTHSVAAGIRQSCQASESNPNRLVVTVDGAGSRFFHFSTNRADMAAGHGRRCRAGSSASNASQTRMSQRPRLHVPGAFYRVILRGTATRPLVRACTLPASLCPGAVRRHPAPHNGIMETRHYCLQALGRVAAGTREVLWRDSR